MKINSVHADLSFENAKTKKFKGQKINDSHDLCYKNVQKMDPNQVENF